MRVIARRLFTRTGVEISSATFNRARDVYRLSRGSPFKKHVFDKMGNTGRLLRFVTRTGSDKETESNAFGFTGNEHNFKTVFKNVQTRFIHLLKCRDIHFFKSGALVIESFSDDCSAEVGSLKRL